MSEHTVELTDEQIRILLSVTGPRIATDPDNRYGDWSVDLDRRLREATEAIGGSDLVQIAERRGRIDRVPSDQRPVVELHLEPHQQIVSFKIIELPSGRQRKTADWLWLAWIATDLRGPA